MSGSDVISIPNAIGPARWRDVRRVLAIRLDNLGDVVMTTPALAALKHSREGMHVTLLASRSGAAAAPHVGVVDDVIVYDAPWSKGGADPREVRDDLALISRLRHGHFDAAVIFTVCTQSALPAALLCRLAGIPLRLAHCRENPYDLLTDWVPDPDVVADGMRHEVARHLALVRSVGFDVDDERLRFNLNPRDERSVRGKLAEAGVSPGERYFIVHAGASAASRRYPAARFGQAAQRIAQASGCRAVFTGGVDEQPLFDEAVAEMEGVAPVSLMGQLSLGELAALIHWARLLVSNNSGPVHMAAALGTPIVDLYALTNPQHTPWQVAARVLSHDVPCRNCLKSVCPHAHNDCLRGIEPQQVVDASLELMRSNEAGLAASIRAQSRVGPHVVPRVVPRVVPVSPATGLAGTSR